MKKLIVAVLMAFAPTLALAQAPMAPVDTTIANLPIEVSVLLLNRDYQRILSEQATLAAKEYKSLRISSLHVQNIAGSVFVYADLSSSDSALPPQGSIQWHDLGSIVGSVLYGPRNEVILNGVYFKPSETPPGGASVGNN